MRKYDAYKILATVFGKFFLLCLRQNYLYQLHKDNTCRILCALLNDLLEKYIPAENKARISEWEQTITSKQWNYSSEVPQNCAESGNRPLTGLPVSSYFRGRLGARWCRKIPA